MVITTSIRNLNSGRQIPARVFDVRTDGERTTLIVKLGKTRTEEMPWEEVKHQVEAAEKLAKTE